jgi:glycosyltransferase involved in cell wall biosynthesis
MKISFVIPSRNNLKYFKWAYAAIRKNQGHHEVFICAADDASADGTFDYFNSLRKADDHFSFISNASNERVGHTVLYDRIVNELVQTDVAIIFHADMYLCPNALDEIERLMYSFEDSNNVVKHSKTGEEFTIATLSPVPKYKTVVSLTRIEPPLHPDGPEKILANFGTEPDQFDESKFIRWFSNDYRPKHNNETDGVFAPWAFFVKDFKEIGGHDKLYIPQSKEDSTIGSTLLFVFDNKMMKLITFEDLWNMFDSEIITRADGKEYIDLRDKYISTLTPTKNGVVGKSKVRGIIRHKTSSDRLYKVNTKWGEVIVTEDHSLITKDLGVITPIQYSEDISLWSPSTLGSFSQKFSIKSIDFNTVSNVKCPFTLATISDINESM